MNAKSYLPFKNLGKYKNAPSLRNMSAKDLLDSIGLQTRQSTMRTVASSMGLFAAGLLLGAGIGMAFAPRRGEQMRRELRERAETMKSKMGRYREKAAEVAEEAKHQTPSFDA
ncbi:MAG: YtxH domain-containing protein [Myxococcota bacterium]